MPAIEKATYAHGHKRRKAYHAVGLLGRGAEAEVRLAQSLETGEFVALKVMAKPDARTPGKRPPGVFFGLKRNGEAGGGKQICSKAEAEMRKRFAALQPLSLVHPRLPTLFEFFESERKWYVAMERCGTDLAHYVEARGGILPENDVAFVVTMLLDLLVILHAHGIVHRDIKPANVLLRETQRLDSLCLADSSNCHVDIRLATEKMGKVSQGEKPANDGPGPELRGIFPSPLSKPTSIDDTGKITPSPMDREAVWSGTTFAASSDFTSEDDDNRMDPMTTVTG